MRLLAKTLLYILSKWDLSMDEFFPVGKVIFYIPNLLHNILMQIWYFLLFPIIYFAMYLQEKVEPLYSFVKLSMLIR